MDVGTDARLAGTRATRTLSRRECEVLALAAAGMTNHQVAKKLDLSVHGVKFHLSSVYRKLGVSNRTEAAVAYLTAMDEATSAL